MADNIRRAGAATRWLEALPLGNGRLGVMAWGDPDETRFGLNEATFWSGSPHATEAWHTPADEAAEVLNRARALFNRGDAAASQVEIENLGAAWSQAFQPVGDLVVHRVDNGAQGEASSRQLDLEAREHVVGTSVGEHLSFVSLADEVLVHVFPAGDVQVDLESLLPEEHRRSSDGGVEMVVRAPSDLPPSRFREIAPIGWDSDRASRAAVVVRWRRDADRMLLVCAIRTSWRGLGVTPDRPMDEVLAEATHEAEAALALGAEVLHRRHRAAVVERDDRVRLDLDGDESVQLLATSFAYGRYLLASSSRPGLPPANLQGIWNTELEPPWSSNFTTNINVEMNHWAAGTAHVPEAVDALDSLVEMLRSAGRETARRLYDADGWVVHHNTDPWGYTDPVRGNATWSTWPMGALWLERELDSLAGFSGAEPAVIAERRYDARRHAAAFALDLMRENADSRPTVFPSTSPENEWVTHDGHSVGISETTGMDRWLIRENLQNLVDAAGLLGNNEDSVVRRAAAALQRLEGPLVGEDGRVLEWHADQLEEAEPHHRHVSHLGFLYPGVHPVDEALRAAATASLDARGDEATGWSLVWKACLWARLHRPDRVQRLFEIYLRDAEPDGPRGVARSGLYPNLFSAHPPFQIDGNLGIVAAIMECLIQSHRGEIELLPALPPLMASGTVSGVRARPGVEVAMEWNEGQLGALRLHAAGPGAIGRHRVRCGARTTEVVLDGELPLEVDVTDLRG